MIPKNKPSPKAKDWKRINGKGSSNHFQEGKCVNNKLTIINNMKETIKLKDAKVASLATNTCSGMASFLR